MPALIVRPRKPPVARKQPDDLPPTARKLRILLERKRRGRTDEAIAEAAGMSKALFSKFLTGRAENPTLDSLRKVLDAIGATLCDFDRA